MVEPSPSLHEGSEELALHVAGHADSRVGHGELQGYDVGNGVGVGCGIVALHALPGAGGGAGLLPADMGRSDSSGEAGNVPGRGWSG